MRRRIAPLRSTIHGKISEFRQDFSDGLDQYGGVLRGHGAPGAEPGHTQDKGIAHRSTLKCRPSFGSMSTARTQLGNGARTSPISSVQRANGRLMLQAMQKERVGSERWSMSRAG